MEQDRVQLAKQIFKRTQAANWKPRQSTYTEGDYLRDLRELEHLEIIGIQDKIIKEYEDTLKFLNQVCFDCVKYERKLRAENSDKHNVELMNFVWETNDHIADTFKCLEEDLWKLKELRGV